MYLKLALISLSINSIWGAPAIQLISLSQERPQTLQARNAGETETFNASVPQAGPSLALSFLRKYGYLESLDSNSSETLYSEETIFDAIKLMQRYGAVPETGRLDNETLQLLRKPRCGVKDIEHSRARRFILGSKGWNKRSLTYRFDNWSPKMHREDVSNDMRKAFDVWAGYAHLKFTNATSDKKVDIAISFGRGYHGDRYPFDGPGGTLAHAYYPQNSDGISGDVHFDEDEPWYSPSSTATTSEEKRQGISFLDVAVHELGHSLGLAHSHIPTSVMFPYYRAPEGSGEPRLDYDDIMAMYHLYISRHIEDGPEPESPTSSWTSTTESSRGTTDDTTTKTPTERWSTTSRIWTVSTENPTSQHPDFQTTTRKTTLTGNENVPDLCKDGFDTISFIRNEIFVFKGNFMWRFLKRGQLAPGGYPTKTSRLFRVLDGIPRIDAAFERESDGRVLFFSGKSYWTFDGSREGDDGPFPLTDFGLPESLENLDGAFVWGKNRMTYFFKDGIYWKYNTTVNDMDKGYPRQMENWRGIPEQIQSVIRYKDDKTYFFKDDQFWRFDDSEIYIDDGFPMSTSKYWFNC